MDAVVSSAHSAAVEVTHRQGEMGRVEGKGREGGRRAGEVAR